MKRAWVAGGVGLGISVCLLLAAVSGGAIWALYLDFPGLWLAYIAVGIAQVNLGWSPVLMRILMVIGDAVIYGAVCYFVVSLRTWWRA